MQIWICQLLYTDAIGCRLNGLAIRRRSVASCKKGHSFQPCTRSLTKEINTKTNWRQLAARRLWGLFHFRFHITEKTCPLYAPPKNGALACTLIGSDRNCQVQCKSGNDFAFNPPFSYYCSGGNWQMFSVFPYDKRLPWPDCSGKFRNIISSWQRPTIVASQSKHGRYLVNFYQSRFETKMVHSFKVPLRRKSVGLFPPNSVAEYRVAPIFTQKTEQETVYPNIF